MLIVFLVHSIARHVRWIRLYCIQNVHEVEVNKDEEQVARVVHITRRVLQCLYNFQLDCCSIAGTWCDRALRHFPGSCPIGNQYNIASCPVFVVCSTHILNGL